MATSHWAAWVAGQYAHINFSDPNNFLKAFHSVVARLCDPDLPVRVDSVFALRSFVEASKADDDVDDPGALATVGCLRAINTILESVSKLPSLFIEIEPTLLPIMRRMLTMDGQEVFEEVLEIVSYMTFFSLTISVDMWSLWPLMMEALGDWAIDFFPSHGTKRLASEELWGEWENKRLNAGDINNHFLTNQRPSYQGYEHIGRPDNDQTSGPYPYRNGSSITPWNSQGQVQLPQLTPVPTLLGKGAKQWRDRDWVCTNCSNHNYASWSQCNRYVSVLLYLSSGSLQLSYSVISP
ncbi:hypothetical protein IFM89_022784 [Coptis chinensis]|uniref:RanBP2-type domain-containing protein n=1 Tax=Coptis chinensis TaxID=261450 RepID=A0A835MAE0_9MAGN|nr:hypothetical protein IFM89_022784 [Coptis chinensis]